MASAAGRRSGGGAGCGRRTVARGECGRSTGRYQREWCGSRTVVRGECGRSTGRGLTWVREKDRGARRVWQVDEVVSEMGEGWLP